MLTLFFGATDLWGGDSITIYIKNKYMIDQRPEVRLSISYNIFYPVFRVISDQVVFTGTDTVISYHPANNNVRILYTNLLLQDGDTIFIETRADGKLALSTINPEFYFYYSWKDKQGISFSPAKINENTSYQDYAAYTEKYYDEEEQRLAVFFKGHRKWVSERLLNDIKNTELVQLIKPFNNEVKEAEPFRKKVTPRIMQELQRIDRLAGDYSRTSTYLNALSEINFFLADQVHKQQLIPPAMYLHLHDTAKKYLPVRIYQYLGLSYLRTIARTGSAEYKQVFSKIMGNFIATGPGAESSKIADSLSGKFELLSTNLKYFNSVRVLDMGGKKLALSEVISAGKPVLFDVWATWCGPCLEELPYIDSVRKQLPDVQIIALSIDEDKDKWTRFNKRRYLKKEDTYLLEPPLTNTFVKHYGILQSGVPRYLLFDVKGNCLSAEMIRPGDKNFVREISRMLKRDGGE